MATPNDDCASYTEESDVRRGLTVMKAIIRARSKGTRFEVGWNERGQPIAPNGSMLVSYIGAIVRQMVPISSDNWKDKALDVIKDNIWRDIQTSFKIDDMHRKFILKEAGKLHRGFKTHLTKKFLRDANGNINDQPPTKYAHLISEDNWRAFVAKRVDDSFQRLSNVNRERASNPLHPYRKSRMGYARLEQKMLQETGSEVISMSRHLLWKAARVNKAGVIDNENVQKVWEQCETLSQSLSPEEVEDTSRNDILARALNVPEYPGRVRGKGFGVSQRDCFPPQKRCKHDDVEQLKGVMGIIMARLAEVESKLNEKEATEKQPDLGVPSTEDSCTLASHNLPVGVSPCQLYLSTPTYRMVGKGKVFNHPGDKLHTRPLPTGHVRVTIEVAFEPPAPLPVPITDADFMVVGDAIGTFVAWPINLIAIDTKIPAKSKQTGKGTEHTKESTTAPKNSHGKSEIQESSPAIAVASLPPYCTYLSIHMRTRMGVADIREVVMEEGIFGSLFTEVISREQISEVVRHERLGVSVVCVYIRYLYEQLMRPHQLTNRFSFLSPHQTSIYEKEQEKGIVKVLMKNKEKDKLFLAPYNSGEHWVLIVINATEEIIYYLDPLPDHGINPKMKKMFNTALQIYRAQRGAKVSKFKSSNITWTTIECPCQTNNIDCGYYILRFMKEIITVNQNTIPVNYFLDYGCLKYSQDKLTEVKEEWCRFVVENII